MTTALAAEPARATNRPPGVLRVAFGMWRTRAGAAILLLLLLVAFFGRYVAPYGEQEGIGSQFKTASETRLPSHFGSGVRGYDVWSRFLYGGRPILIAAALSTLVALVFGTLGGLIAAYNRGRLDTLLMRSMDIVLALPQILAALVILTMFGAKTWLIVLIAGVSTIPRIARVVRGAAVSVVERDFIAAAEAIGEPKRRMILSELLPNVAAPLLVEATLRLTFAIGLIAGISFLGFVEIPGLANWGLMVSENRKGLRVNHWGVTLPVLAIAALTIATGLIGDGIARATAGIDRQKGDD